MSDLLIENTKLPETCSRCLISPGCIAYMDQVIRTRASGHEQIFDVFGEMRLKDCPLSEIPEHGDLIDKNFLLGMLDLLIFTATQMDQDPRNFELIKDEIENAPVVLASNEESK